MALCEDLSSETCVIFGCALTAIITTEAVLSAGAVASAEIGGARAVDAGIARGVAVAVLLLFQGGLHLATSALLHRGTGGDTGDSAQEDNNGSESGLEMHLARR